MGFTLHRGFESLPLRFPPNPHHKRDRPPPAGQPPTRPHRRPRPGWKANWKDATGRSPRTPTRATPTAPRAWRNGQAENRPNAHAHIARSTQRDGGARARVTAPVGALTGGSAPRQGRQHPSRVSTCFPVPGDPAPRAAWRARPCSVSRRRLGGIHPSQGVVMLVTSGAGVRPWPSPASGTGAVALAAASSSSTQLGALPVFRSPPGAGTISTQPPSFALPLGADQLHARSARRLARAHKSAGSTQRDRGTREGANHPPRGEAGTVADRRLESAQSSSTLPGE